MSSSVKKRSSIERPRPLLLRTTSSSSKLSSFELSSVENTLSLLENVAHTLKTTTNYESPTIESAIINLSASLKSWGPQLEMLYKDQMDKCQINLRNAARDEKLDMKSRLHLLEIIELRAMGWTPNESLTNYYKQKIALLENNNYSFTGSCSAPIVNSNVIPNFSVSPGSKDRLVRITGPGEANVQRAKSFIEDTIQRNASPVKESLLTGEAKTQQEYKYTVDVGDSKSIKITGNNLDIIKTAKLVLEEYFEDQNNNHESLARKRSNESSKVNVIRAPLFPNSTKSAFSEANENKDSKDRRASFRATNERRIKHDNEIKRTSSKSVPIIKYDRKVLYNLADNSLSKNHPKHWESVMEKFPDIAFKVSHSNPLPVDWEANFIFTKKPQYSQHCDRRSSSNSPTLTTRVGHNSRA